MRLDYQQIVAISLLFVISACGFHLRQSPFYGADKTRVQLINDHPYSVLMQKLKRNLKDYQIKIVDEDGELDTERLDTEKFDTKKRDIQLTIGTERFSKQVAVRSLSGTPEDYQFYLQVDIELLYGEHKEEKLISVTQDYHHDSDQLVASYQREKKVVDLMRDELINKIMIQLSVFYKRVKE